MYAVMFTVACYTISSLGDKYISSKLKCTPAEFSFIVSSATMAWIGIAIPLTGWGFSFHMRNCLLLLLLAGWKTMEFYTSAALLKSVSAYELKAWLGINIACSYYYNVMCGIYQPSPLVVLLTVLLPAGIIMTVQGHRAGQSTRFSLKRICLLSFLFILSKFLYGLTLGWMASGCKPTSTLFLVMLLVALTQLKRIKFTKIRKQKGIGAAALTRLPNAAGLICEASVAMESLFLYAMVQPAQLAILFGISLIKKEPMSKKKLAGSLICIFSVCAITVLISK